MYVYFVRAGKSGPIKIGMARNVQRRVATLQTGNAYELHLMATISCKSKEEAVILENRLHGRFKNQNIRGEWFQGNIDFRKIKEEFVDVDKTKSQLDKPKSGYVHIKNAKKKRISKRLKECG